MAARMYNPDPKFRALADSRCKNIAAEWFRYNGRLEQLIASCYLQGARDMVEAYRDHPREG